MKHRKWFAMLVLVLLASLISPTHARADMAPPEQPPGTNIVPGKENTQVRMVAETVTLTVLTNPSPDYLGQAATEAVFTMRNLGTETETMEARFPLTFWNAPDDGYGGHPEITDIQVWVDSKKATTHRIGSDVQSPWAAFTVTFPPGKDVIVTVKYTTNGYASTSQQYFNLRYILETGAGWKDTIGSADIIVKLPYEASNDNVGWTHYGDFPSPAYFAGNEIRWHYENFEPTPENNVFVSLVIVSRWQNVLHWRKETQKNPKDGEAWGQLGKAIKEATFSGISIPDNALYHEAVQAYEKALSLLPNDALWHYGFADLLWKRETLVANLDYAVLSRAVSELQKSQQLGLNNPDTHQLASDISSFYPWALSLSQSNNDEDHYKYDYLILTATPTTQPTEMPTVEATSTPQMQTTPTETAQPTDTAIPVSPTKSSNTGSPVCGGAALIVIPALAAFWLAGRPKPRRR